MSFKDILAPLISIGRDEAGLVATETLAARFEAHATALIVAVHLARGAPLSVVLEDVLAGAKNRKQKQRQP